MGDEMYLDENAMDNLHWAMKVPYPTISFVTGAAHYKHGEKYKFNNADLGNSFAMLLQNNQYWQPMNQTVSYVDYGSGNITLDDGSRVYLYWGNIAPRFDQKYERIAAYRNSYCVCMFYTALCEQSFKNMQERIAEAEVICSQLLKVKTPMIVIIGMHYHFSETDIEVPFSKAEEYAASIGVKIYPTFGEDKAEQAKKVICDVLQVLIDQGLLLKDNSPSESFEFTKKAFYGHDPQTLKKKRTRCIIA